MTLVRLPMKIFTKKKKTNYSSERDIDQDMSFKAVLFRIEGKKENPII